MFTIFLWGVDSFDRGAPCLQVASHLISGLSAAVEGCVRASSAAYGSQSMGPPSRVAVAKAAYNVSPPLHSCWPALDGLEYLPLLNWCWVLRSDLAFSGQLEQLEECFGI